MVKANGNGKGTPEKVSLSLKDQYALPEEALYGLTEIILKNGLRVWVYQQGRSDYHKLKQEYLAANPEPDKKEFERPVPEDDATIPGQMLSAESNPAYQDASRARVFEFMNYLVRAYVLGYTDFPDYTEDELIKQFERVIARKRKVIDLPEDAWEATLFHAILTTDEEKQQIVNAVEKTLAVEMVDVIDAVAIFRPVDSRNIHQRVPQETVAQSPVTEAGIQQDQI